MAADSRGFPGAGECLRFAQQTAEGTVSGSIDERSRFCMMLQSS